MNEVRRAVDRIHAPDKLGIRLTDKPGLFGKNGVIRAVVRQNIDDSALGSLVRVGDVVMKSFRLDVDVFDVAGSLVDDVGCFAGRTDGDVYVGHMFRCTWLLMG